MRGDKLVMRPFAELLLTHVVTHASIAAGVGTCSVTSVCRSACPSSKRKTAWTINTKLGTHILYSSRSACIDPEVKGQRYMVTKTVTVARLLVTRAATAMCCCCRRGSACRYDCLHFLVIIVIATLQLPFLQLLPLLLLLPQPSPPQAAVAV